jgi:hypothetical protein
MTFVDCYPLKCNDGNNGTHSLHKHLSNMLPIDAFWPILVLDVILEIVPVDLFCDLQGVACGTHVK